MPRYFFHLTFGDRVVPDEEGTELPSRAAAREEAMAAARELCDRASTSPRSRWASWFLQVADEGGRFLRLPLGYPALEVVSADHSPPMEVAPPRPPAAPTTRLAEIEPELPHPGGMLAMIRRALARRRLTLELLERNRQLRQELASQFLASETARGRARELVSLAQAAYSQHLELQSCGIAPPPRPHLHLAVPRGGAWQADDHRRLI